MPVARGPQINARSAVLVGITGVLTATLLGAMVLWLARSSDSVIFQMGDTQFDAGFIGRQSAEITSGGPILYPDAGSSGERDIYVQHIGDDPEVGWLAFSARRTGDPRQCSVLWDVDRRVFELVSSDEDFSCDPVTFNELGCGLPRVPVGVIDDKVIVFLNDTQEEVDGALADTEGDAPVGPNLDCPDS